MALSNSFSSGDAGLNKSNSYEFNQFGFNPVSNSALTGDPVINKRIDYWVYGAGTGTANQSSSEYHTWYNSGGYDLLEVWMVGGGGGGGGGNIGSITGYPPTILGGGGGGAGGLSYYRVINPTGDIDFEIGRGGLPDQAGSTTRAYYHYGYMFANAGNKGIAGYNYASFMGTHTNTESKGSFERGQISNALVITNTSGYIVSGSNRKQYGPGAGGYGYSHITGGTFVAASTLITNNWMDTAGFTAGSASGVLPNLRFLNGGNILSSILVGGNGGAGGASRGSRGGNGGFPGGGGGGGAMEWAGTGTYTEGGTGANGCVVVIGYKF